MTYTPLSAGDQAPDFTLPSTCEKKIALSELKGSKVVLYFYPKDDTSGCTIEAREFSELKNDFDKESTIVIGVSPDSIQSHEKFCKKYDLSIILISDESKISLNAYGVWKEKIMFGRQYMGVERTTFLIDERGIISKIWNKIKVKGHAHEVLNYLRNPS
ncbi:MAG: thioredoxin-dependent thiol peroxidase [Candidatus Liberibacter europaeus]|uniref:thioredoxin-dependent peroxiredoxin n=1 Tax=Candidatus Liberibacter europaeus TaxID=744859 RepID=A0A2T4VXA4_9HYPH|nr:thioredoxin-dependent thiol peroxidase [Candidatus Liberibacter europaeus]PTL86413.1 MAG: thioredoxin-dependent thiol peroxidase [Candidatus Liberibacter europaeus]